MPLRLESKINHSGWTSIIQNLATNLSSTYPLGSQKPFRRAVDSGSMITDIYKKEVVEVKFEEEEMLREMAQVIYSNANWKGEVIWEKNEDDWSK